MYVTRPLSIYRRNPHEMDSAPLPGPHSGLMVLRGEERDEAEGKGGCFGCGYAKGLFQKLPLPQNAILHSTYSESGDDCLFIPVLDQPVSSNRYHVIHADGPRKGLASRCSTEEDTSYCCSKRIIADIEPTPFDYRDEHQQFEICGDGDVGFYAKPIVPNCFPPTYLRFKFHIFVKTSKTYHLQEAQGLDLSLRSRLPELDSTMIIGKWYAPFVFVKGDGALKVQMKKSLFYTITLETHWQNIFSCENDGCNGGNSVAVNVSIEREVSFLFGIEAVKDGGIDDNGFVWFRTYNHRGEVTPSVPLTLSIFPFMVVPK